MFKGLNSLNGRQRTAALFVLACSAMGLAAGWVLGDQSALAVSWKISGNELGMLVTSNGEVLGSEGNGPLITANNIYPGWSTEDGDQAGGKPVSITIRNSGTLPFECHLNIEVDNGDAGYDLANALEIKIDDRDYIPLKQVHEQAGVKLASLATGEEKTFTLNFRLPEMVGNEYQGQRTMFSLVVAATGQGGNEGGNGGGGTGGGSGGNSGGGNGGPSGTGGSSTSDGGGTNVTAGSSENEYKGESEIVGNDSAVVPGAVSLGRQGTALDKKTGLTNNGTYKKNLPRTGANTTALTVAGLSLVLAGAILGLMPVQKR